MHEWNAVMCSSIITTIVTEWMQFAPGDMPFPREIKIVFADGSVITGVVYGC